MDAPQNPQIYLISPPSFELGSYAQQLAEILDEQDIACVRLAMSSEDADDISRAADLLRETCHQRDVALVIERHFRLVQKLGLDGCHLLDGAKSVRDVRQELGNEAIVGAYCSASQHQGMSAGEAGADYVSFGPLSQSPLGDGTMAERDLFQWWSEMIEVPVVAEGGLTAEIIRDIAPVTDFFAFGAEIWNTETPKDTLADLLANMG